MRLMYKLVFECAFIHSLVFGIFFLLNLVLWAKQSSGAIPFTTLIALLALWFGISVPLTFIGAYFGFRKRVRTNYTVLLLFVSL